MRKGFREKSLGEGDVLIGCTGWRVDEEIIKGRPEHVGEKLTDHGCLFGTTPYDG